MANTLKPIAVFPLTGVFQTIYTVPAATTFTVSMLHLVNTTGSPVNVRVCVVPNAGSAGVANSILWDFNIAANDVLEIAKGDMWNPQAFLSALGSGVNVKLSGIETA